MPRADTWAQIGVAFALLAALGLAYRAIPKDRRPRGRLAFGVLALAALARLAAAGAAWVAFPRVASTLGFLSELTLATGSAMVADLVFFDVLLERMRIGVPRIVRDILQAAAFFVLLFGLLGVQGVDVVPLVTTSAVLTAVVGLALQSTMANLFAGLALQVDRAFVIGDWIQVNGRIGRIVQIRWRSTSILTRDGDVLVVPNGQLTSNEVLNLSGPARNHRVMVEMTLDQRHAPNAVKRALVPGLGDVPGVLAEPAPCCVPAAFNDLGVVYRVFVWVIDPGAAGAVECEVRTRLWYAARRAGLEMPSRLPLGTLGSLVALDAGASDGRTARRPDSLAPATRLPRPESISKRTAHAPEAPRETADDAARVALIERVEVFEPLDAADRAFLAEHMRTLHFAAGERILRQGAPGDALFLVQEGEVEVHVGHEGDDSIVAALGTADFFGEMSLLTGEPCAATCLARTDVVAGVVEHAAFKQLLEAKPRLAEEISVILSRRRTALRETESARVASLERQGEQDGSWLLERIRAFFGLDENRPQVPAVQAKRSRIARVEEDERPPLGRTGSEGV